MYIDTCRTHFSLDLQTAELLEVQKQIDCGPVECWTLAWSPKARLIASGSQSGAVNLWSVDSGTKAGTLDPHGKFSMSLRM